MLYKIRINNHVFLVKKDLSILEACAHIGIVIPRFCYHKDLSIAGNCRMCLVEIKASNKLVAACAFPISNEMEVYTNTPKVMKARQNIIQFLLTNHPLDCPICDQGGECDLQDQAKIYGNPFSVNFHIKRSVSDKTFHPYITTYMNRCIHCTRCVRYGKEIAGQNFVGTITRGNSTEIGPYFEQLNKNKYVNNILTKNDYKSGHFKMQQKKTSLVFYSIIDAIFATELCPVGALLPEPDAFPYRPWECEKLSLTIDLSDSTGSNINVWIQNDVVVYVGGAENYNINGSYCTDKMRFLINETIYKNRCTSSIRYDSNGKSVGKVFLESVHMTKYPTSIIFHVLPTLDANFLASLKNREFTRKDTRIRTSYLNRKPYFSNLYLSNTYNKISKINDKNISTYIILGCSLALEAAVLNKRLRTQSLVNKMFMISGGIGSDLMFNKTDNYNCPTFYLNISINNFVLLIEGKHKYSKFIIETNSPLFIFGDAFLKRFTDSTVVLNHILKYISTASFIKINSACNSEAFDFYNIKAFMPSDVVKNKKNSYFNIIIDGEKNKGLMKILKTDRLLGAEYNNISCIGRIFLQTNKLTFKINKRFLVNSTISPRAVPYEHFERSMFINLEGRPQFIRKMIDTFSLNLSDELCLFFTLNFFNQETPDTKIRNKFNVFLDELSQFPNKFESLSYLKCTELCKKKVSINSLTRFSPLPIKLPKTFI